MQRLIIEFKNKLEKNKIVIQNAFDNYIYYYVLESITRLAAILQNNELLASRLDVDYSLQITKFFEEPNVNFLDYKIFKVNFKINNVQDVINIADKLEKVYNDVFKIFPIYCQDMKAKHGKEIEDFLSYLSFECALVHNHLQLINSDLKVLLKYKEIKEKRNK